MGKGIRMVIVQVKQIKTTHCLLLKLNSTEILQNKNKFLKPDKKYYVIQVYKKNADTY